MINIQNPVYYPKFRHIQPCCGIFRILCNSWIFKTLSYSESWHIRAQDKSTTLSRRIRAYLECCVMVASWEPCHIQNFVIFRILAYLRPQAYSESSFRHIQVYSDIFNNDSYNSINSLFFLTYFSTKLKKTYVFWIQWNQF